MDSRSLALQQQPAQTVRTITNRFNRGEVDVRASARQDVERIKNSGDLMENFMPVRLGPMQYRPGFEHLNSVPQMSYFIPFVAATTDTALLEASSGQLRVWVNETPIVRPAVTSTITNGTFNANITGWTDASSGGGFVAWDSTNQAAALYGTGTTQGAFYQTITIVQTGVEHGLRFTVAQMPIYLEIGTTVGGSEIYAGELLPGTHSLAFTPTGNVTLRFSNLRKPAALLDNVSFDAAGALTLPLTTPTDLKSLRYAQSVDVVFVAGTGIKNQRIERRGVRSWSVVDFYFSDGPFEVINTTGIKISVNSLAFGNVGLTASASLFRPGHVGALFKLISAAQNRIATAGAANVQTASILVTGVGATRNFTIDISGTFVATVTLQKSLDNTAWVDVKNYTVETIVVYNDTFDNQLIYYRLNVKPAAYTSGTVEMQLFYASGSTTGIARVYQYVSPTVVNTSVLKEFGGTDQTLDWYEGSWSPLKGYPSSVALHEGRLWWAGKNRLWGSVSDIFDSYDRDIEGNSASIQRTIGFGPADNVDWLYPANVLLMGLASNAIAVRSNSFGEVMTNLNTTLRKAVTQGVASLDVVEADSRIYYIQRSKRKIFELDYSSDADNFPTLDLNVLTPRIAASDFVRMAVTRQPETRIYCVMADGSMLVYLHEFAEDVRAWSRVSLATGAFEDVVVLPGTTEDSIYAVVLLSGSRYLVKLAQFGAALGASASRHLDLGKYYASPGATATGLAHLNGLTVRIWADGQDRGTAVVSAGSVTLPSAAYVNVTVGLAHTANYRSNKLSDYVEGWVLNQNKRVDHLGFVLENVWPGALTYGSDAAHLSPMPLREDGQTISASTTVSYYDELPVEFNGSYRSDSRVYLRATGPVTVLAMTYEIDDPNYPPGKA